MNPVTFRLIHGHCTRPCRGCSDPGFHTAHMTWWGSLLHIYVYDHPRIKRALRRWL